MVFSFQKFQAGERVPGTVYRVEALVGSGGMGSVYLVEHTELGRKFVLKALHGHLSAREDLVARLRNEWRALAKLDHPNIVQVTDAGQTSDGLPFYVMESLEGATLGKLLSVEGRIVPRRACQIIGDVLAGLHAAHETGAIHRDIKPPNIFVGQDGTTKLLDFGIAKLRDQAARVVTAGGVSIGTPRYMAPEQAEGTKVDGRADIYAAGLVLFEILVGKGPFAHITDPNDLVMAHISQEPERADFVRPDVPPELADLVQRWLSKSPDSRPRTAEMAKRELNALALGLAEHRDEATTEVTVAGVYDAATWGAEPIEQASKAEAHVASAMAGDAIASAQDVEENTQFGSAAVTETLGEPGTRGPDDNASARVEPAPVGPAGTLGWGTTGQEQAEASPPQARGVASNSPGSARGSVTPPPLSSHAASASTTAGRGGGLRWVVATAVVSFLVAWGASQLLGRPSSTTGKQQTAPTEPSRVQPSEADRRPTTPEELPITQEPDQIEPPSAIPVPEAQVPKAQVPKAQAPAPKVNSKVSEITEDSEVPQAEATGSAVRGDRKAAPARPPPPKSVPPKPRPGQSVMPGSGLW